ncbi:dTDP-glucose 4,6-dehydratase [Candidatus Daviesbacteria bacterium RIFCSPHIGHO2_01_FULL_40_11]|uniref:dTDP-glucose 4,6-dehydratase n=1 Tax=Candidatus Daviesbacteria bacterium RIFCSPHIGHO2_01_FULL_40_11 TaxID=1797762 RepID=A0A1F5JHQ4_9BACT|nr:MAG: dTDP-glucose 4,6-dehydratase [Candidatus Daviesbacteria bacterium RIFCSPHIGHO2_01_FULL_40_11]OGE63079.1 MAG: dTDP-glucose 4,6-dehydratase [Candidatus Daviesbacteria bacterium RIFCSPLOWO2_01_FULL_40_27]
MKLLITGGAGFIGSNFIHYWLKSHPQDRIVNLDALTYAGHPESLKDIETNPNYQFIKGDIADGNTVEQAMDGIDVVVHFAAESHVDRSIIDPLQFVRTNVLGTAVLLNAALEAKIKRFHHVSTDEVYGELGLEDPPFTEDTPYNPRTPYSASKAGSDHLVRAYFETYGLPVTITNCANNYGPYHDPEKLIPRFITNLLEGEKVPLMGKGENIREWLHVGDHAEAIDFVLQKGEVGETYLIQGEEKTNMEITQTLLSIMGLDESMIEFVEHRLGHDFRYAINGEKLKSLGWERKHSVDSDLQRIVGWYKENEWWWKPLKEGRPIVDRMAQKSYGSKIH